MPDRLQDIETSRIDELIAIRKERAVLVERLSGLEEEKGEGEKRISEVVYERIRRDYESQAEALAERATPLEAEVRREYAKLRGLLEGVQHELDAKGLDREELEVRHRLGEFDEDDFQQRISEVQDGLDEHQRDLDEISKVRERFVAAFDSEDDLRVVEPPEAFSAPAAPSRPEEPGTPPPPESSAETEAPQTGATVLLPPVPPPPPEESGTPSPPGAFAETEAPQTGATVLIPSAPAPAVEEMPAVEDSQGATSMLPLAYLVPEEPDLHVRAFPVEPLSFIGRTSDNQVQVDDRTISRRHARISLTNGGYVLEDLTSENGSYVNGQRIHEQALSDGDRVQIGMVRFVFQLSLPGPAEGGA